MRCAGPGGFGGAALSPTCAFANGVTSGSGGGHREDFRPGPVRRTQGAANRGADPKSARGGFGRVSGARLSGEGIIRAWRRAALAQAHTPSGKDSGDQEFLAVLAFDPLRRLAAAGPGGASGLVAVFGRDLLASGAAFGTAAAKHIVGSQVKLGHQRADLVDRGLVFALPCFLDLLFEVFTLLQQFLVGTHCGPSISSCRNVGRRG